MKINPFRNGTVPIPMASTCSKHSKWSELRREIQILTAIVNGILAAVARRGEACQWANQCIGHASVCQHVVVDLRFKLLTLVHGSLGL